MILDNAGLFSEQQAITSLAAGSTVYSDNWMDFGVETERNGQTGTWYRDWANGKTLYVNMLVTTSFTTTDNGSPAGVTGGTGLEVELFGFPTGGTPVINNLSTTVARSTSIMGAMINPAVGSIPDALTAGSKLSFALSPLGGLTHNTLVTGMRYLRAAYKAVGGSGAITGAVSLQLAATPETTTSLGNVITNTYPATVDLA